MTSEAQATALQAEAVSIAHGLYSEARSHKRQSAQHRRASQKAMQELLAYCEANGIEIEQVIVREDKDE